MSRVKCGLCISYQDSDRRCAKKKVKVAANKRRKCGLYELNEDLDVKKGKTILTRRAPHPTVARELRRRARKSAKMKALAKKYSGKHPLTGNLDAFKTTASEE